MSHLFPTQVTTLVIGSGPSGFSAAYYAAQRGPVLLIDSFILPRDKSCGGMIHPLSQRLIEEIAPIPRNLLLDPPEVYFRYNDLDSNVIKNTSLRFLNVDRAPFDEWLLSKLPGTVSVYDQTRYIAHRETTSGLQVDVLHKNKLHTIECSFLVGADGARSKVRKNLGLPDFQRYVTLQDYCLTEGPIEPAFDCFWFEEIPEFGVGYIIPKNERTLVGLCYYPGTKRAHELQDHAMARLRSLYPIGPTIKREAWIAPKHTSLKDLSPGVGRVLLTGEAGGYISPTSGEGISWALDSGKQAGLSIAQCTNDNALDLYRDRVAHLEKMIAHRLRMFPLMNSKWGKKVARFFPERYLSHMTQNL